MHIKSKNEKELESEAFEHFKSLGYETVEIKSNKDLEQNFKKQFIKFNKQFNIDDNFVDENQLEDQWFTKLLGRIKDRDVIKSYKILRENHMINSSDSQNNFKNFYLKLLNQNDWCKNLFQIARQVIKKDYENNHHNYRYDLVLLINGIPLVLIELKQRGGKINDAFRQIDEKYCSNFESLFCFLEIFVISNFTDTEYFVNQIVEERNKNVMLQNRFQWADFQNKRISNLRDFILEFLSPCRLAQIISRYIILREKQKRLFSMF